MSELDARQFSLAAQEVVRLRAVVALESGRVRTYGEAASVLPGDRCLCTQRIGVIV